LVCGMIGSAVAAVISISTGVEAYSIGVGGLPGILSIKPQFWLSFLAAMAAAIVIPFVLTFIIGKRIAMAAAIVIPFVLPFILGKRKLSAAGNAQDSAPAVSAPQAEQQPAQAGSSAVKSPITGRIIPLDQIPDQVFSQGILGEGVGIEPTGTEVLAPGDGTV